MTTSVRTLAHHCPRCGGSHGEVRALPVAGTPPRCVLPSGVREMTHWYLCPTTGSPVLVVPTAVAETSEPESEGAD